MNQDTIPSLPQVSLDFDLHKLVYLMDSIAGQKLTQNSSPITYSQYLVLSQIGKYGEINQRKLSQLISISDAAISRQVELLKQRKFLNAMTNVTNRRERILTLTTSGQKAVNQALEVIHTALTHPTSSLEDQEIANFNETIYKLIGVFAPLKV